MHWRLLERLFLEVGAGTLELAQATGVQSSVFGSGPGKEATSVPHNSLDGDPVNPYPQRNDAAFADYELATGITVWDCGLSVNILPFDSCVWGQVFLSSLLNWRCFTLASDSVNERPLLAARFDA